MEIIEHDELRSLDRREETPHRVEELEALLNARLLEIELHLEAAQHLDERPIRGSATGLPRASPMHADPACDREPTDLVTEARLPIPGSPATRKREPRPSQSSSRPASISAISRSRPSQIPRDFVSFGASRFSTSAAHCAIRFHAPHARTAARARPRCSVGRVLRHAGQALLRVPRKERRARARARSSRRLPRRCRERRHAHD